MVDTFEVISKALLADRKAVGVFHKLYTQTFSADGCLMVPRHGASIGLNIVRTAVQLAVQRPQLPPEVDERIRTQSNLINRSFKRFVLANNSPTAGWVPCDPATCRRKFKRQLGQGRANEAVSTLCRAQVLMNMIR
jgi:hypothetical protein